MFDIDTCMLIFLFRLGINLIYSSQVWVYIVCMGESHMDHKVELHAHDTNMFFFPYKLKLTM